MKKFCIFLIFCLFLLGTTVQAKTIKVTALENFSTEKPASTFKIKTIEEQKISKDLSIPQNSVISGIVIKIKEPRRGKRNSAIELLPTSIVYDGETINFNESKITGEIIDYKPVDKKELTLKVGTNIANFFLKGIINAAIFVQGVYQNQYDGRIKSGVLSVYKRSFLTYIETGHDLNISSGDVLVLKIKKAH